MFDDKYWKAWSYTTKVKGGKTHAKDWRVYEDKDYRYTDLISALYKLYLNTVTHNADNYIINYRNYKGIEQRANEFLNNLYAYVYMSVGDFTEKKSVYQEYKNYNQNIAKQLKKAVEAKRYMYDNDKTYPLLTQENVDTIYRAINDPLPQLRADYDYNHGGSGNGAGDGESLNISMLLPVIAVILLIIAVSK